MSERFWWINDTRTPELKIAGAYLWFARSSSPGKTREESQRNFLRILPGDVILLFAEHAVRSVGVVLDAARESAIPLQPMHGRNARSTGGLARAAVGWVMTVQFMKLPIPLHPEEYSAELAEVLPKKNSPIRANGSCNQHVCVAAVPEQMVRLISRVLRDELEHAIDSIRASVGQGLADDAAEAAIRRRRDLDPSQAAHLLKARHGQGLFRERLEAFETTCRLTGLSDRRHLDAVHMKPWSDCDDHEKLDGHNGLLLSPHFARLFYRGHISFADDGELLISPRMNPAVLVSWGVRLPCNVGAFGPAQCRFLAHHRREVFGHQSGGRRRLPDRAGPEDVHPGPPVVNPA
jgi:putative restriction endonuclease